MTDIFTKSKRILVSEITSVIGMPDSYPLYDEKKVPLGRIIQTTNFFIKIAHVVLSNMWLSYSYKLVDAQKKQLGAIRKVLQPWSDRLVITDKTKSEIGYVVPEISHSKCNFTLYTPKGKIIATVTGNYRQGEYLIFTQRGAAPGKVVVEPQNWLIKTLFSQLRYSVQLPELKNSGKEKRAIILLTIMIPILVKEIHN